MARNYVRVRLFRKSLGGGVLLSFSSCGGAAHVFLDGGAGTTRTAAAVVRATGGRLDALVVTHGHAAKFLQPEVATDRLRIGEAWLAESEDAHASDWLRTRAGKVRSLRPTAAPIAFPGADGVRVYVLGPHSGRPANPDRSFASSAGTTAGGRPFEAWFCVPDAEAWADDFFGVHYGFEPGDGLAWRRIETDWLGAAASSPRLNGNRRPGPAGASSNARAGPGLLFPYDSPNWAGRTWRRDGRTVTPKDLFDRTVLLVIG